MAAQQVGARVALAEAEVNALAEAPLAAFFGFLECQLRFEALRCLGATEDDVPLEDPTALRQWSEYLMWQKKNKSERWVPFHTVFGVHELYAVRDIKHSAHGWDAKQKFFALFVFRAHCKIDLFEETQVPRMKTEEFWKDPVAAFAPDGKLEKEMLEYRQRTGAPMQTNAFRAIPQRILEDNDENLVRNVTLRTQSLLGVAEAIWPLVRDNALGPEEMFARMAEEIKGVPRLGETWVKMLCASIDISYPELSLLKSQCSVGIGALPGIELILQKQQQGAVTVHHMKALQEAKDMINSSTDATSEHFWAYLAKVEEKAKQTFKDFPHVISQVTSEPRNMTSVTLQVQMCEWRQFCEHLMGIVGGSAEDG